MIPFLKCPLIPTFPLLIKARRCDQKTETFSLKEPFTLGVFCATFLHSYLHLSLISRKKTENHM